jgi:hypothetical protein
LLQKQLAVGRSKGAKNPMWQGGKSFEPYTIKFNSELKI